MALLLVLILGTSYLLSRGSRPDSPFDAEGSPPSAPSPADAETLARASNGVGLALFRELAGKRENLAISPIAAGAALFMIGSTAGGETSAEVSSVLGMKAAAAQTALAAGGYYASLRAPERLSTCVVATRLFGDRHSPFATEAADSALAPFGTRFELVDFVGNSEAARQRINSWAGRATDGEIPALFPPGSVSTRSKLVLASTLSFRARWSTPFDPALTTLGSFHPYASHARSVDSMHVTAEFKAGTAPGAKLVELPFDDGTFAMAIFLPDSEEVLSAFEQSVVDSIPLWLSALRPMTVAVSLPRFEMAQTRALDLVRPLSQLGLTRPFDSGRADFSPLLRGAADGANLPYVGALLHEARFRVDERGARAPTTTAVATSPPASSQAALTFVVDRPFAFVVREIASGMILIVGHVEDPSATGVAGPRAP